MAGRPISKSFELDDAVMTAWEDGLSRDEIATKFGITMTRVRSILGYMREGRSDNAARYSAIASGSAALLCALRRHHPERCA